MIPSTSSSDQSTNNSDLKAKVYVLVNTLTDLNPNIKEINNPIEESNALLKDITEEIKQLNTKSLLLKLAQLAMLEKRLPDIKTKIDIFINNLETAKVDTTNLCSDYSNVIETLKNTLIEINETDPLKADTLGIVSINNLKLKNIQNQIESATSQIANLERFRTVTLYHLSDTINNSKTDKDLPIVDEISRVIKKFESRKDESIVAAALLSILTVYNFLADKYHVTYDTTKRIAEKAVSTTLSNSHATIDPIISSETAMKFINTISMFGVTCGLVVSLFHAFGTRSSSGLLTGMLFTGGSLFVPMLVKGVLGVDEIQKVYTEQTIKVTYDFYNFGSTATFIFLSLIIICLLYTYFKQKDISRYTVVVNKLQNTTLNADQNASDLVNENA